MRVLSIVAVILAIFFASQASAQEAPAMTHQHMAGMQQGAQELPTEAGQSAFAAIQEIVQLLEADPRTDWSKVDIEALRQHLIDMNAVTLRAKVKTERLSDGRRFLVTGEGDDVASIRRMLAGHAATMNGKDGWSFSEKEITRGAALTVKPPTADLLVKLDGLGFIGVLAMGMHHQAHHWMIANGMHPH